MSDNKVFYSKKLHKLGNKDRMTDYNLHRNINSVAHRNNKKCITGFIVVCNDCMRLMEKLDQTIEMVVKPGNAIMVKDEEPLYSVLYNSSATVHKFESKDIEMIMITQHGITLRERTKNDSNKKNTTKI